MDLCTAACLAHATVRFFKPSIDVRLERVDTIQLAFDLSAVLTV